MNASTSSLESPRPLSGGETLTVNNVLTGEELYRITELSEDEAAALAREAREEFERLKTTSLSERLRELAKVRDRIYQEREAIVDQVVRETGKSRTDALVSEVLGVLDYFDWLLKFAPRILKDKRVHTPLTLMGRQSRVYHQPLGPVMIIAPWNYPFHIAMTSIAAALAAGNTVLFKPSELTPLKGLIEHLMEASPLLRRTVRVAYGSGVTAQRLIDQRPVKIFFTGSARTGRRILAQAAPYLIPVELELGGKDAAIVFDDVNLERTVAGVLWGALTNAGQSCTSIERLYVHEGIYDAFVGKLKEEAGNLVVNAGDAGDADIGSLTVKFQCDLVRAQLEQARQGGARITGGELLQEGRLFLTPAIVEDVDENLDVWAQETFGPVIAVSRFASEDEVIRKANATEYGLSASVWSADLKRARRVARALEVGAVSINNVMLTEGNPALPFGGVKASGFGRVKGAEGLLGMVNAKAVIVDRQSKKLEANWYPFTRAKYRLFDQLIQALFGGSKLWLVRFVKVGLKLESLAQKPRDEAV